MTLGQQPVVVVTGAGSGIGRATAELFAERGFAVVAVDRSADGLQWTSACPDVSPLVGDITEEATNSAMVTEATDRYGRLVRQS